MPVDNIQVFLYCFVHKIILHVKTRMQTHRGEKGDNDARPPPNAIGYIQI